MKSGLLNPTEKDRILSSLFGYHAICELKNNKTHIMIGIQNNQIVNVELEKSINNNKKINKQLINLSEIINNY